LHDVRDIGFGYATETMRSGSDQERRIGHGNVVEVQAQGDHARQHLERWCDVKRSVLACPGPEAFNVHSLQDGDCPILMPTKSPIGARCLVEEDGPYRMTRLAEDGSRHGAYRTLAIQERAQVGYTEQPDPDLIHRLAR
jgi:hypothetical protein